MLKKLVHFYLKWIYVSKEVAALNKNNINKILNPKHAWSKIVDNPNDWDSISVIISNVMRKGVESVYTKKNGGKTPALKRVMQVAGETVEVTFIRLPNGQIKISDAWVKTRK